MAIQQLHLNSCSGPTTHDVAWNSAYTELLSVSPHLVAQLRSSIAYHGAGHALIQMVSGAQQLALRMPSFSDSPHVELLFPLSTTLPCNRLTKTSSDQLLCLCHMLAGYWAEDMYNQGDFRDVAGSSDAEEAYELADAVGASLGVDPFRLISAVSLVVESKLGLYWDFLEDVRDLLVDVGFIGFNDLKRLASQIPRCNLGYEVLAQLADPSLEREMDAIERRLW